MLNQTKTCKHCLLEKNFEEFYFHKSNKDKLFCICKKCHYQRTTIWRSKNKHKTPAYSRTSSLRHRYGIDDEQYDNMVKNQCGLCLICGEPPKKTKAFQTWNLHVDHCHETGKVRGLLCHLCNRGLGLFRESKDLLEKAAQYIKSHN